LPVKPAQSAPIFFYAIGEQMKTCAAVAFEAKKPLEIIEVDLAGPKADEVLVEIMATGICHTDA